MRSGTRSATPGDDHAAVAVADQDHPAQVVEFQQLDDVGDVGFEIDGRAEQMLPLAQPVMVGVYTSCRGPA